MRRRALAEKHQVGHYIDGPVDGPLQFDQKEQGVGLFFDESPIEAVFFHQGKKGAAAAEQLFPPVAVGVWVHLAPVGKEPVSVGQQASQNTCHWL